VDIFVPRAINASESDAAPYSEVALERVHARGHPGNWSGLNSDAGVLREAVSYFANCERFAI